MKYIGRTALVTPVSIDSLEDVDLSTLAPVSGDLISFDGTNWVPLSQGSGNGFDADLLDGFEASDFATAAEGALAGTALQPGDNAELLGSGSAADKTVLVADGAGDANWATPNVDDFGSGSAADGTVLTADGSGGAAFEAIPTPSVALDDLTDVDTTTVEPYEGATLTYDSTQEKWNIEPLVGTFTWDSSTSSPAASQTAEVTVTPIHEGMRRCVVNDAGVVQYYLKADDSTKKEDGSTANIDGTDGQVMVEIPKFYVKRDVVGTETTWSITNSPQAGFTVHPAFVKDGVEVDYRYYGAYHASYFDDSAGQYKSGLNLDNLSVDTNNDVLASVSGVYPVVGLTRNESRLLAANRGSFWRQLDYTLWSAVQLLYLVEYQTFYSQDVLGRGNVDDSYSSSSSNQSDSPHSIAGRSNTLGNASTDTTSGASTVTNPPTAFMSYRGIENFYGNGWQWVDGINVNVGGTGNAHVTNDRADFADDTSSGMTLITSSWPTGDNYVDGLADTDFYFAPSSLGGSSSTYTTDYSFGDSSSNRVVRVGGGAGNGSTAGAFAVVAIDPSSDSDRAVGSRLAG